MSKTGGADGDERILSGFKEGMASWASAVDAHKHLGFAARLAALAQGASDAGRVCREADAAGFQWPPARKADSAPPYELRPGTGRRGPEDLWQRFGLAITRLSTVAAGEDMLEVGLAYEELASIAGMLAEAVAAEDEASSKRPKARGHRAA